MKLSFAERLINRVEELNNPSLLGLDPKLEYMPDFLLADAEKAGFEGNELVSEAFRQFNQTILEELCDTVAAVKFQSACYEAYGPAGLACLYWSISYAQELGFLSILDAKRNDIGSSASAYAAAGIGSSPLYLSEDEFIATGADAITLNGYLGIDGIEPFLSLCREEGKGCFILVRTSNPSAGDLQDLELKDGRKVYEAMADLVRSWSETVDEGEFSSVGAVVGATWPEQAKELRANMPRQIFLIPGYGAQGGQAKGAVAGFKDGKGGIVNSSRGLMLAWQKCNLPPQEFAKATKLAAEAMKEDLNLALAEA